MEQISRWIEDTIINRADQSWTPEVYASPSFAEACPQVAGYTINADAALERAAEIRVAGTGEVAARYCWG